MMSDQKDRSSQTRIANDDTRILIKAVLMLWYDGSHDAEEEKQLREVMKKYDMDLCEDSYYDLWDEEGNDCYVGK